jgi:hypothetical protein
MKLAVLFLFILSILGTAAWLLSTSHAPTQELRIPPAPVTSLKPQSTQPSTPAAVTPPAAPTGKTVPEPPVNNALITEIIRKGPRKLKQDELAPFLNKHKRSAQSLIIAYYTSADPSYLIEATGKYPQDPEVLLALAIESSTTEAKLRAAQSLSQKTLDNTLGPYLSALAQVQLQEPAEAIESLKLADARDQLSTYRRSQMQAAVEAYTLAGYPELEAQFSSTLLKTSSITSPLKLLSDELYRLTAQYLKSNDRASAVTTQQLSIQLAEHLLQPDGNLAEQSIGVAILDRSLQTFPDEFDLDGDGRTIAQRKTELDTLRTRLIRLKKASSSSGSDQFDLTRGILAEFTKLQLNQGEIPALEWLAQQRGL